MVEISDLRDFVGLTNDSEDVLLLGLERRAVALLEKATGRHLGIPQEIIERRGGAGQVVLLLRNDPDTSLAITVELRSGSEWVEVSAVEWFIDGNHLVHATDAWDPGDFNLRITYTAGYDVGQAPGDLEQAVLDLVEHWLRSRSTMTPATGEIEENSDEVGIPDTVQGTIERWRTIPKEAVSVTPFVRA